MRLQDIFKTPTVARVLDFLLANPTTYYSQKHLVGALDVDKATIRRTIARLQRLGLVEVDLNPVGVRLKVVRFNDETEQGKALLGFHRRIATPDPESDGDESDNDETGTSQA